MHYFAWIKIGMLFLGIGIVSGVYMFHGWKVIIPTIIIALFTCYMYAKVWVTTLTTRFAVGEDAGIEYAGFHPKAQKSC